MRLSYVRSASALLVAVGMVACGGKASFDVSGTIAGLSNPGLVLANGGSTVSPAVNDISFVFPSPIDYGTQYNITVQTPPTHMNCSVSNGSGSAGRIAVISATVTCTVNAFTIGGTINGLTGTGLELTNGSLPGTVLPQAGATNFAFAGTVPFGQTYGVTVLKQPAGQVCSVANGTATMGDANISNIAVTCVTQP